ncbi:3 beta-hydroxysteroid dehydrogenase type 7-like protein [Leptotrombidium deliense]|uniref:3 beta-hydroxysteroid dehydrogenase type 7-like protein n=1 Tax=Leptotrombidium deliense TaxID=299467 RepID=A0A443S1E2_9ACAR|nr:3 beta-hydroxysteroid dehydrogenase type 7-like protein [Leptotrombidium deliense]
MKVITGDIRNTQTVSDAVNGVKCIIHCAALIDTAIFANEAELNSVNVIGTKNLIEAAIAYDVPSFVFVSTIDVLCGSDPIYYGAENTVAIPKHHCFEAYSKSKLAAEEIVIRANGTNLTNGFDFLRTVVLRPTGMYGEYDKYLIPGFLKTAKNSDGCLPRIDNTFIRVQLTYVGNAAWACIKAKQKLESDESIGGEVFFITDDTPIMDPFEFAEPYLKSCGLRLSQRTYPYWLLISMLSIFVFFVKLIRPLFPVPLPPSMNPGALRYITNIYFYNRNKSTLRLDYEPIFDENESQTKSLQYYSNLNLSSN